MTSGQSGPWYRERTEWDEGNVVVVDTAGRGGSEVLVVVCGWVGGGGGGGGDTYTCVVYIIQQLSGCLDTQLESLNFIELDFALSTEY